jgi:hypothetical protein
MVINIIPEMTTAEIEQLYERWKRAIMNSDLDLLDKICDGNFSWTNCERITNNKKEHFYRVACGNVKYLSWINEYISTTILGDIASLRTRETIKMIVYKQKVDVVHDVIALFIKVNGKWLLAGGEEFNSNWRNDNGNFPASSSL